MILENHYKIFIKTIGPDKKHVEDAKLGHEGLREKLEADEKLNPNLAGDTFLSGSYRRNTAVKPVKDVDIFIPLNFDPEDKAPRWVLEFARDILEQYYEKPDLTDQRRSIRVEEESIVMDIVPALIIKDTDSPLLVPDREQEIWIKSHPKGHISATENANKKNGRFVPLVKVMKWWRNQNMDENTKIKSFILESVLVKHADFSADSHAKMFLGALENIASAFETNYQNNSLPDIPDPALPSNNLSEEWSTKEFRSFMRVVKDSIPRAKEAIESEDEDETVSLWQQLLGDEFPTSDEVKRQKALEAAKEAMKAGGALGVSSGASGVNVNYNESRSTSRRTEPSRPWSDTK